MPNYCAKCKTCGKIFDYFCPISERNNPVKCECGSIAERDVESEFKVGRRPKWVSDNPRWSVSMGVPPSQVEDFRKRFPNSVYDNRGRLLVKNRKDKIRQMRERGFEELGSKETPWLN